MESLIGLVGREVPCEELCRKLYFFAGALQSPVVGAVQVTCADESERECVDVHERVDTLSPERARELIDVLAAQYAG